MFTLYVACGAGSLIPVTSKQDLLVAAASWRCYSLPLQKPLTTEAGSGCRQGLVMQVQLRQGDAVFCSIGEVAPLPGESIFFLLITLFQYSVLSYLLSYYGMRNRPWFHTTELSKSTYHISHQYMQASRCAFSLSVKELCSSWFKLVSAFFET